MVNDKNTPLGGNNDTTVYDGDIVTNVAGNDVKMSGNNDFFTNLTGIVFLVLGIIGAVLSGIINTEKIALLEDAQYELVCDLNAAFSCSNVMNSAAASTFGFPNMIIGLFGFGIIATIGAGILAGARYKHWFWFSTLVGLVFAIIFSHWLFYNAVYIIGALCTYCMGVWAVSIALFMNVLAQYFKEYAPETRIMSIVTGVLVKWWWLIFLAWYGILMLLTYIQFAY